MKTTITLLFLLASLIFLVLGIIPEPYFKSTLDALMPDGTLGILSPENAHIFRLLFILIAALLGTVALLIAFRSRELIALPGRLVSEARELWQDLLSLSGPKMYRLAVLIIVASAAAIHIPALNRAMMHDESYTVVAFASSLRAALTDYHLPNNHVLHSVLVFFSTSIFGFEPWAARLPTFLASLGIIVAVYLFGTRLYNPQAGLLAALLTAFSPALSGYYTEARGYALLTLLSLTAFILADIVRTKPSLPGWSFITLFSSLGFLTNPIMLFPTGILFAWLFLENLFRTDSAYHNKRDFLLFWVLSGVFTAILSFLFYAPIFIFSGPGSVFQNSFVRAVPWDAYSYALPARIFETLTFWAMNVPLPFIAMIAIGFIIGLVTYPKNATHRFPIPLAALIWITILLVSRRPDPHGKLWVFLNPIILAWAASGLNFLLGKISLFGRSLFQVAMAIGLVFAMASASISLINAPARLADGGSLNLLVLDLKNELQPGDWVIASTPDDAPLWFYAKRYGINADHFNHQLQHDRLLVITNSVYAQTLESILNQHRPEFQCAPPNGKILLTRDNFTVYECLLP